MTKIFILEDNPERMYWFRNHLDAIIRTPNFVIFHADNIISAKELYNEHEGEFDIYFLDHDLGGEVYVDSNEPNTGYQFAKFMVEQGITGENEDIFCHSLNFVGRANILSLFKHARGINLFNF